MPSDEYAPLVRGGLKLKGSTGAKPSGVEKKKQKKKRRKKDTVVSKDVDLATSAASTSNKSALGLAGVEAGDGDADGGDADVKHDGEGGARHIRERKAHVVEDATAGQEDQDQDQDQDQQEEEDDDDLAALQILVKDQEDDPHAHKTPAERRHEETRRKRLQDRLHRDASGTGTGGTGGGGSFKTHKQRVEELNRYLSRLSEHHDMPRIGPG